MSEGVNRNQLVVAGVTTAAMAVAVVGHMFVLDWFGRKLQEFARRP